VIECQTAEDGSGLFGLGALDAPGMEQGSRRFLLLAAAGLRQGAAHGRMIFNYNPEKKKMRKKKLRYEGKGTGNHSEGRRWTMAGRCLRHVVA